MFLRVSYVDNRSLDIAIPSLSAYWCTMFTVLAISKLRTFSHLHFQFFIGVASSTALGNNLYAHHAAHHLSLLQPSKPTANHLY